MKHLWEVDHPYYSSESNYYTSPQRESWGSPRTFDSWKEFIDDMGAADEDMNLIFRWDWERKTREQYEHDYGDEEPWEFGDYYSELKIFIVLQRKGTYWPIRIRNMRDEDEPAVIEYLKPKLKHLLRLWEPLEVPGD